MSLTIYPRTIRADGTALAIFKGPPDVDVVWQVSGGTLTQAVARTTPQGIATALFTPSAPDQQALIEISYPA